jgi:hypothetical protein
LVSCGLGDPCLPQNDGTFTKDTVTDDMTVLFRLALDTYGDDWISKRDLRGLISPEGGRNPDRDYDLFPQWNLDDHKGQTAFGQALQRYKGRILGGIRMETDEHDKKRIRYRFTLAGGDEPTRERPFRESKMRTLGTLGTSSSIGGGGEGSRARRETGTRGSRGSHSWEA